MYIIEKKSFAEGYYDILNKIYNDPDYIVKPRGKTVKECYNLSLVVTNPLENFFYSPSRITNSVLRYLAGELYWYFSGSNSLNEISEFSRFWKSLKVEGHPVESAYGYLIFKEKNEYDMTEWQWAYNALIRDKDTRQAIIRFNKPRHSYPGVLDFVCTLFGIFHIRNDKLHFTVTMRSQDEYFGRTYDFPFWSLLLQQMRNHLLPTYPILELGTITHLNISSHIYEKDFKKIKNMLDEKSFEECSLPQLKDDLVDINGNFLLDKNDDDPLSQWIIHTKNYVY